MSDFDPNRVAAEFLQANLETAVSLAAEKVKGARTFVRARFERTYRAYVQRLVQRHSRAKSFFIRSEPIPLYEFFVPLDLHTPRSVLSKPSAVTLGKASSAAIVTGTGGSGKSMVMRHLLLSALASRAKTPLFVELRTLNTSDETLTDALLGSLVANGLDVDQNFLTVALKAGHFLILLDGYDELNRELRAKTAKAIQDIAERYPQNWIVVSSRPDSDLQGWTAFTTWQVADLDLSRAVELVARLTFDETIKAHFIDALEKGLFEKHKSFLSNPLLLSIMLLTYHDTANIPDKLSVFYNQAYESLFQKHDALKAGYQRERLTKLDIQEFARVFAAFCVQSFDKREFTFPTTRAIGLLDHSKVLTRLSFKSEDFLKDSVQAVCLLVEEGVDIGFAHRSFQEYFAALFIVGATPSQKAKLVKRFAKTVGSDAVISLLQELDAYTVEKHYILPALRRLKQTIAVRSKVGAAQHLEYLRAVFGVARVYTPERPQEPLTDGVTRFSLSLELADHAMLETLLFAHGRYCPEDIADTPDERRNQTQRLGEAFVAEFDGIGTVRFADLTVRSAFVTMLSKNTGPLGRRFLSDVLALVEVIEQQHRDVQESLNAILS